MAHRLDQGGHRIPHEVASTGPVEFAHRDSCVVAATRVGALLFIVARTEFRPQERKCRCHHHHHHYDQSLIREGRWGTRDDFATSFLHFSLFSTALWDLLNSRPVHSLMLSSHRFLFLPCLLPPFTALCQMVLARPEENPVLMCTF